MQDEIVLTPAQVGEQIYASLKDEYLRYRYVPSDIAGLHREISAVGETFFRHFPYVRKVSDTTYHAEPIKVGGLLARHLVDNLFIEDRKQKHPAVIKEIVCAPHSKKQLYDVLDNIIERVGVKDTNDAVDHANTYGRGLLLPLFGYQSFSWRDRLRNESVWQFGQLEFAQMRLEFMMSMVNRYVGHGRP